jgi:deoxyribodipyrimidine photo-lyase
VPTRSVVWFRRDLRLADHPALVAATQDSEEVLPLFVVDPALWGRAGEPRKEYLRRSLAALDAAIGGHLVVRIGDPTQVVPEVVDEVDASEVHISADFGPYGSRRDHDVERALDKEDVPLVRTGSPYAVSPGRVVKGDGTPYRVYTPFYRAWLEHGWRLPAERPSVTWVSGVPSEAVPRTPGNVELPQLPDAGEVAALERWSTFRDGALDAYADARDRPDLPATSRLSVHLKFGEIHPRTLLHDLGLPHAQRPKAREVFRKELAWREFYADVLHHEPRSAREYYRHEFAAMEYDTGANANKRLLAWQAGRTGYPIVDAGMRQLLAEGWMHNRVRMIVASFLVKDLHLEWQHGARWFMRHLVDGDLASNSHGWQWTAGCGTDAAPYFRIFNPVTQGKRFDPDGAYIRRYVPELRHVDGGDVHEPWAVVDGGRLGYPERIVDHAAERHEALTRYELIKQN